MVQPETSLKDSKYKKIMDGLDVWTAYYRANPVRFLIDYFGMEWIRPFQQVMITFMFRFIVWIRAPPVKAVESWLTLLKY